MKESAKPPRLPPEVAGQTPAKETVALDKLVTDSGTQVRTEISDFIVSEYAEALADGARFPPVVVFRKGGADVLADGFHRVRAYEQAGRDGIEANVYEGGPDEALWFALGANRAHGQRLCEGDKRRAIELAYKAWPDVSQRRIAAHVGCNQRYVGTVRAQLSASTQLPDEVVGRDGRRRPATRTNKARKASTTEEEAPPTTSNQQPDTRTAPPDESAAQPSASGDNNGSHPEGKPPEQASAEPGAETSCEPEPEPPDNDKRPTKGTAKQAARDRSNRIVSVVADNALHLTAQDDLIDFGALDREQLPKWIEDLEKARRLLQGFIRRLREEL